MSVMKSCIGLHGIILLLFSTLVCPPAKADDNAVVFMYHRFGEQQYPSTNIRVDQFRQQLQYLQDADYRVIPLAELVQYLKGAIQSLPPRSVVITIDDAYRSVYEVAYPLLMEYDYPFTVFVSGDTVDRGIDTYMTWEQIRTMTGRGASIANHGAAHISMVRGPKGESREDRLARTAADVKRGMRRLEEELPDTPHLLKGVFAYPYGEYDTDSAEQVTRMGYLAFGQHSGAIGLRSDRRALPRYPMNERYAGMEGFRVKAASGPLPVIRVEPWDPVTTNDEPELVLTLDTTSALLGQLACYVGGQGSVQVNWLEKDKRFNVVLHEALSRGRHRVNCTAPATAGHYLWFSHPWIVR